MKTHKFLKLYILLLVLFSGFGIYLMLSLFNARSVTGLQINPVKAEGRPSDWDPRYLDKTCRYRTGGGECAVAEFTNCNPSGGQVCVCRGEDAQGANGWTYAMTGYDTIENTDKCDPRDMVAFCRDNPGASFTLAECHNGGKCPGVPPTPTPTTQPGSITVRAYCAENNQELVETYEIYRSDAPVYYESGPTTGTKGGIIPGYDYGVKIHSDNNNGWPNLRLDDSAEKVARSGDTVSFRFAGCVAQPTQPPTSTPTQTPTPTPTPAMACENMYLNGNTSLKTKTLNPGESVDITMIVNNPTDTTSQGAAVVFNSDHKVNGVPDKARVLPNTTPSGYSEMTTNTQNATQFRGLRTPQVSGTRATYTWKVSYDQLLNKPDANFDNKLLVNAQLNGYGGGMTNGNANCVVFLNTQPQTQNPQVRIRKTLISGIQPKDAEIMFNIDVTNTGNVDITDFTLTDDYDPAYLEFKEATYNGVKQETESLPLNPEGRKVLRWKDMPPGNVVLKVGDTFTLTVKFKILKESVASTVSKENDNCGVVSQITYRDQTGTPHIVNVTDVRFCAEYLTPTPNGITVQVNKEAVTRVVSQGQPVQLRARITNNSDAAYTKVNFIDNYDKIHLEPVRVEVTAPNGRKAAVNNMPNTGVITINDLQDLTDGNGNKLGGLEKGQSYVIDIFFVAKSPIDRACDKVTANVTSDSRNATGTSPEVCVQITTPPTPPTGANVWMNTVLPVLGLVVAGGARIGMKYGIIGN